MSMPKKWVGTIATLWTAMQLAACSSPVEPTPVVEPEPEFEITAAEPLYPGERALLQGRGLDELRELIVDGEGVDFEVLSPDEVEFSMPITSECDVDGRPAKIVANGSARAEGLIRLRNTLELEVGESRILSKESLQCLQLSGEDHEYVLSVANFSLEKVRDTVFQMRSHTTTAPEGVSHSSAPRSVSIQLAPRPRVGSTREPLGQGGAGALSHGNGPFDDYANAEVGDTLRFVDWTARGVRAPRKEDVPTYTAVVIALAGNQMILVDQRVPHAADFDDPSVRAAFQEAAEIADRYTVPAIRAVIDPDFQQAMGAGGRMLTILRQIPYMGQARSTDITAGLSPWTSNMYIALLTPTISAWGHESTRAGHIAGTIIHEMAHLAITQTARAANRPNPSSWYNEALAETVLDMAARMALGREEQAPVSRYRDRGIPMSHFGRVFPWKMSGTPLLGEIGNEPDYTWGSAAYDRGARILRYAQERLDQHYFNPTDKLLHQRLLEKSPFRTPGGGIPVDVPEGMGALEYRDLFWNIDAIAREIGMSAEQLLEESMLADLTDDLLPREAVERFGLPQIKSWDNTPPQEYTPRDLGVLPEYLLSREEAVNERVEVAGGVYAYWFVDRGRGRGLTVAATDINLKPHHKVRITRLR